MHELMVTRTVTLEMATAASMLVRITQPAHQSLHRALAKAEARLVELPWSVDGGVLCISSHSHPGQVHYCEADVCDCLTARGTCWHRAAYLILSTIAATGVIVAANLPLPAPEVYARIEDGDYPGDFLDTIDGLPFDDAGMIPTPAPFRLQSSRVVANPLDADVDALFAA